MIVRLGNDHTNGTTAGKLSPLALFADNDYALGMIVEGVSKSRFWAKTAIFVIEDDAQNGPDHVDSHRSVMLAVSPYHAPRSHRQYDVQPILGAADHGADSGTAADDAVRRGGASSDCRVRGDPESGGVYGGKPRISLTSRNPPGSSTAERSAHLDFKDADLIDDDELNDILWAAIKGTDAPAPVRSYFSRP